MHSVEGFYSYYEHDPRFAEDPRYVDIRAIMRDNMYEWLDELSNELAEIVATLERSSRWIWCLSATRLDGRPWGQAAILKPLLFAKAVMLWRSEKKTNETLTIRNAPPMVSALLQSWDSELCRSSQIPIGRRSFPTRVKDRLRPYAYILRRCKGIFANHVFRSAPFLPMARTAIMYQSLGTTPIDVGYRYFFTALFDDCADASVAFMSLGVIKSEQRPQSSATSRHAGLLDFCRLRDLIAGTCAALRVILRVRRLSGSEVGSAGRYWVFWRDYLEKTMDADMVLEGFCTYRAIRRMTRTNNIDRVIYPYEEKGIERAILFACAETSCRTIGFCPHPQHQLAVALKDRDTGGGPKPDKYGVCGEAYKAVFTEWARKPENNIETWGTAKSRDGMFEIEALSDRPMRILFLISHPWEVTQLHAWLATIPELKDIADIHLRMYKADDVSTFNNQMSGILGDFPWLTVTTGSLEDDLKASDITAFCATSAGPEAVLYGKLSIFVDLNDAFPVNACFDTLEAFLPCYTAKEFFSLLVRLRESKRDTLTKLFKKQQVAARSLFSPINHTAVHACLGTE